MVRFQSIFIELIAQQPDSILWPFLLALMVTLAALVVSVWQTRCKAKEVARLQAELEKVLARNAQLTSPSALDTTELDLHRQLFQQTDAYADLLQLKYMRDQIVSVNNRTRLMQAVEEAYGSDISRLKDLCPELSNEDVFLCLMSMMKFSTHDVASCLGVSDDAIRKRRSRLRQKLAADECAMFGI